MSNNGWIGVDLDGTIAHYDGWRGIDHVGKPIPRMVERVKAWLAEGQQVKIFTARVSTPDFFERARVVNVIEAWCKEHIGQVLPVTNVKDFSMVSLYDDRAIQVEENTGRIVVLPK